MINMMRNVNISSQDFDMSIELDNVVKIDGDKDTGKIETKSGKIISYTMLYRPWLKDIDKVLHLPKLRKNGD